MTAFVTLLVAIGTGLVWASAHPGPSVWWLVFAVVPGWLTVARRTAHERVWVTAAAGFVLGLAAFLPMLRWLALPATTIGWVLLASTQAAWVSAATVTVRSWTDRRAVALVGPVVWTGMEVLRARVPLSGFGWGDLASAHTDASYMLTVARVLGADGLTLITALLGATVWATIVAARPAWERSAELEHARTVVPTAARVVAVIDSVRPTMLAAIGVATLGLLITAEVPPAIRELDVLVVQGNDGTNAEVGLLEDLRLAELHADATIDAVATGGAPELTVWAENALDRDPSTASGADLAPALERAAAAVGGDMIVGVIRDGTNPLTFRNSLVTVDANGTYGDAYDKQDIVPFGEYVPWRSVLGDLPPLRQVPRDAIAGAGPVTLHVAGVRVAPVICFETLFGPTVRAAVADEDAGLIVAGTNDASFGRGAESAQHVNQSRLRAVETGRTVIHASIAGTSAIIDADGHVVALAPLYEVASLRANVAVVSGRTPAMLVAGPLSLLLGLAAVALAAHAAWRSRAGRFTRGTPDTPDTDQEPAA